MSRDVFIVSAVRTPIGKFNGGLSQVVSSELGATVLNEALIRAGLKGDCVDEAIMGNVMSTEPRGNPAREAVLKAGLPIGLKSYTVNKNCGSGLKTINLAAALILAGEGDIYLVGGMENMSRVPYVLRGARTGMRMGHAEMRDLLLEGLEGMGLTAENLAKRYSISREEQDEFACRSQAKATEASRKGFFKEQVVAVQTKAGKNTFTVEEDEGIKPETTLEGLAALKPAFLKDGTVTPGNSSTINDGAAALVLVSESKLKALGLTPLARIVSWAEAGVLPEIMGIGPVPAVRQALQKAGLNLGQIDLVELNEAFAAQALSVMKELEMDAQKVNVNGGAIALGHPVGASGAILAVKMVYEMKRSGAKRGLITLCIGGGQGIATIIECL